MLYFAHEFLLNSECARIEEKPYFESCVYTKEAKCYFLFQELLRFRAYLNWFLEFRQNILEGRYADKDANKIKDIYINKLEMVVFAFARINTLIRFQQDLWSFAHDETYYLFYKETKIDEDEQHFIVNCLHHATQILLGIARNDEDLEDVVKLMWKM